jgi:hypothetical protein
MENIDVSALKHVLLGHKYKYFSSKNIDISAEKT